MYRAWGGGGGGGLLKFRRLIYCGHGVFITKVKSVQKCHLCPTFWLLLEGQGVVCPMHGWFWKL